MYLYEHTRWTDFTWDAAAILPLVAEVRFAQGLLLGRMSDVGFDLRSEAEVDTLVSEVVASSGIEGVVLDAEKVRSSVARQLGLVGPEASVDTRDVDGAVSIMLDATRHFDVPLSYERLQGWHNALFPTGYSGLHKICIAQYRNQPMHVVSGAFGKEKVHFSAPAADRVPNLMSDFIAWFNDDALVESLVKAGLCHLWFLTIHPFDDGNGRIARALTELLLVKSDSTPRRFYNMAVYILAEREAYYAALEQAQRGGSDVTLWLMWFLRALKGSIDRSSCAIQSVFDCVTFWKMLDGISLNARQHAMLVRLKGGFEGKLTATKWAKICEVSSDTALRDINDLIGKGILTRESAGGRSVAYSLRDVSQNATS